MYNSLKRFLGKAHGFFVFSRRTDILSPLIASLLPVNANVLDVGCGDGTIDEKILFLRPDVKIIGAEVLKRKKTLIPVTVFDGKTIPFPENSFDAVLLIDTLHHTTSLDELLKEAVRVSKKYIIIKDHYARGKISKLALGFMDWVGNEAHDVNLTYNYYSYDMWNKVFKELELKKEEEISSFNLYPFPFGLLFERNYHFLAKLTR